MTNGFQFEKPRWSEDQKKIIAVAASIIFIVIVIILVFNTQKTRVKSGGNGLSPQKLEEYRKIQPF